MTNTGGKYGSTRMVYGIPFYGDTASPATSIESTAFTVDGYAKISPVSFVVNFLEPVFDFTSADFSITNGSVQNIAGVGSVSSTSGGDGYTSYSFEIVPTSTGTVLISIPGGNAFDASGNAITSDSYSFIYDNVGPIPTISSETVTNGGATGNNTNSFTVTFDEPVYGFTSSDILITSGSGTVSNFVGSSGSSVYTFDLTISSGSSISFRVPSSVCQDYAGNNNSQSALFSFSGDITRPTVTITSSDVVADGYTNKQTVNFTITFSEPVTGFVVGDIEAGSYILSNFTAVSSTVYTVDYTRTLQGSRTFTIPANVASDAAGNLNEASATFRFYLDTERPYLNISSDSVGENEYTNLSVVPLKIASYGGPISGFTLADLNVVDGYFDSLVEVTNTSSTSLYTFNYYPASEGLKTITIDAYAAQDLAGNLSYAESFAFTYDITKPTLTISSDTEWGVNDDGYAKASPVKLILTFSEPVPGFDAYALNLTNASIASIQTGSEIYTVDVIPSGQGAVSASLDADEIADRAGNLNLASNVYTFYYDSVRPTATITCNDVANDGYTNISPLSFSIEFSEPVSGFILGDIEVTGGTKSNFSGSGASYSFTFTPSSQGTKTISIPQNGANDIADNYNQTSSTFSFTYDVARPSVTLTSSTVANDGYTSSNAVAFTATFSESVSGFVAGDIVATGGTVGSFSGSGAVYTFTFTPSAQGSKSVSIPENVASDSAGNLNTASSAFNFVYDSVIPTVTLTASVGGVNKVSGSQVTNPVINFGATFSEAVSNFVAADVDVTNGTLSSFATVSDSYYTFTVTAGTQGTVTVGIQSGVAQDAAGNTNSAASSFNIVFDNLGPQITVTSGDIVAGGTTRLKNLAFTVTFGEGVTGFEASDIVRTNCTINSFTAVSATVYTFELVPTLIGEVEFEIPANTVYDQYSNGNQIKRFTFFYGRGVTGSVSGTLLADTVWVDNIKLTGKVVVPNGITLTIDPSAYIQSDGHAIIVENGGVLNTGSARLPRSSVLRSNLFITE